MRRAHIPFALPTHLLKQIKFCSPNIYELQAIARALQYNSNHTSDLNLNVDDRAALLQELKEIGSFVNQHIENVIITLGSLGVLVVRRQQQLPTNSIFDKNFNYIEHQTQGPQQQAAARFYPTNAINKIANVSGAGDSFNCGFITAMINGRPEVKCISVGFEAAKIALMSPGAVAEKYFDFEHSCWTKAATFVDI